MIRRTLLLLVLLGLLLPTPASAHAVLVGSDPPTGAVLRRSPAQVRLTFSEAVVPGPTTAQVLDAQGRPVDRGAARVPAGDPPTLVVDLPPLPEGTYTVAWQALSAVDGHLTRGVVAFAVGVAPAVPAAPEGPVESAEGLPALVLLRALTFLATTVLVGALVFWRLVLAPVARAQGVAPAALGAMASAWRRLLALGWGLLVLLLPASLAVQALTLGRLDGAVLFSHWGLVWLGRLGLLLALGGVLWRLGPQAGRGRWALAGGLSGALLLSQSLQSHSAALREPTAPLLVLADGLHLLAVAAWLGGLGGLVGVLPRALAALAPAARRIFLARLVGRFSALALGSVGVVGGTGLLLAVVHIGSLAAAVATLGGRSFLLKLGLVGLLLGLGAVNLLVVRPRLARAVRWERWLWRTVRAEVLLGVLVLLVTGLLTSLPPARQTYAQLLASRPLVLLGQAADLRLRLSLAPARPGPVTVALDLTDRGGRPVAAERVGLTFRFLDREVGEQTVWADPQGPGRYGAAGVVLGLSGRWQVEVLVRRPGQEEARTAARFLLTPAGAQPEGESAAGPVWRPTPATVVGGLLVLLGTGLAVFVGRVLGLRTREGWVLLLANLVVVGLGLLVVWRTLPVAAGGGAGRRNPFPPTPESLARGEAVYRAQCQVCHGPEGRGDGPLAPTLVPRPADLRAHLAAGHTDGELFAWISEGIPGSGMPAFGDRLSEEERWHVINFLRTFAQGP